MTSYYDNDFDINDFKKQFEEQLESIEISNEGYHSIDTPASKWNSFFETHNGGNFFKPRNYIIHEFQSYFSLTLAGCHEKNLPYTILEVGSGYGCTLLPLVQYFLNESSANPYFVATDYSQAALSVLSNNDVYKNSFSKSNMQTAIWDVTLPLPASLQNYSNAASVVLSIFALSAVCPELHSDCLYNISTVMSTGSYLLVITKQA